MRWMKKSSHRIRSLFRRGAVEQELDQELQFHVDRQIAVNMAAGMTKEEARRAAAREFGGVEQVKEECRDERRMHSIETLAQDLRYAARTLRKNPGFAFFAIVVLALGIAASTAIFSIVDVVLLRPLPYRDAKQLVMVWENAEAYGFPHDTPSPGDFSDWRARNQVFEDMAALTFAGSFDLTGEGTPEELSGKVVTTNLFSVLGVTPFLGRDFRAEDGVPGATRAAILNYGLWMRRFGGDPRIAGKQIWLNNEKRKIVGVMGQGFQFQDREAELWVPARFTPEELANHGSHFLNVVARLKPGVRLETANSNLATIAKQIEAEHPDENAKIGAYAVPLRQEISGDRRPVLLVLAGAVCFVLLIACANVANLLLARASSRQREIAMRLALGASRWRIIRQMLTESGLIAVIAGTAGLLLSVGGTQVLTRLIPHGIAPTSAGTVNGGVLLFAIVTSLTTGILFGMMPALRISKVDLIGSLKQGGGKSGVGRGGRGLRDALVVCEVALAIVLLAGAAPMIRSFENLFHLDKGFLTDHVLVVRTPLPKPKYAQFSRRASFYRDVLARVEGLPGVVSAGYTTWVPFTNEGGASGIEIQGHPQPEPGQLPIPNVRFVSAHYFQTLRMKLIEGRLLDDRDGTNTPPVA